MTKYIRKTSQERVKEILNAALKVFLKKGYSNATMEDIINETSLSKGGFYYYFKSKEDIFLMILEEDTKRNINFIYNLDLDGSNKEILDVFSFKVLEFPPIFSLSGAVLSLGAISRFLYPRTLFIPPR